MDNPVCKKVVSMLSQYIEHKLEEKDRNFVEQHFLKCPECYRKYREMKEITGNLHFEYEKLLSEFEREEEEIYTGMREYEIFHNNISPYIDDELSYDESIKFRKYLLKSKPARRELAEAYGLKNGIKNSADNFKNKLNVNYAKKIVGKLKSEKKESFDKMYLKTAVLFAILSLAFIAVSCFLLFGYFNKSYANTPEKTVYSNIFANFPSESELVAFYFDENGEAILIDK